MTLYRYISDVFAVFEQRWSSDQFEYQLSIQSETKEAQADHPTV